MAVSLVLAWTQADPRARGLLISKGFKAYEFKSFFALFLHELPEFFISWQLEKMR